MKNQNAEMHCGFNEFFYESDVDILRDLTTYLFFLVMQQKSIN